MYAYKTDTPIHIDGRMNEAVWKEERSITDFQMSYPHDTLHAKSKTFVQVLFDDKNLYIGAICQDEIPGDYVVQSLKRDFDFNVNDAFAIFIDAFSDATNGLGFAVNPYGVQWDGIIANGGTKNISTDWDGRWFAEVWHHPLEKYWSVEIAIPLKTLRFNGVSNEWRINFARNDLKRNELSTWVPIPRGFEVTTLSRMAALVWEKAPQKPGPSIALNPYMAASAISKYDDDEKIDLGSTSGIDAKVALTSSLNLDITVNPDFSQAEVDRQVIDLQRFELFFPERRPFFLENSDLFAFLGNSRVRPFFSRRIGSAGSDPLKIHFGARVSGKLNRDWRIGLMSMQTEAAPENDFASQNFSVGTIQRRILNGSNITAFITSRQSYDNWKPINDYNRVTGLEFDYRSQDSKITGKAFLHYAFTEKKQSNALAYSSKVRYKTRKFSVFLGLDAAEENYATDMGYVPRLYHEDQATDSIYAIPYTHLRTNGYYRFFVKNGSNIDFFGPEIHFDLFMDTDFKYQEYTSELSLVLQMTNTSRLSLAYEHYSPILFFPFVLSSLDQAFPAGNYTNDRVTMTYDTGKRKNIFGKLKIGYGGEYKGKHLDIRGDLNYRMHRQLTFGLNFSQQNIAGLPDGYGQVKYSLVGSKIELSFTRNIFFTTFLQYNTQKDNFNINSRFNWRFHPMSDLFLVYTENYRADNLAVKDRALVLKLNYWIGL